MNLYPHMSKDCHLEQKGIAQHTYNNCINGLVFMSIGCHCNIMISFHTLVIIYLSVKNQWRKESKK